MPGSGRWGGVPGRGSGGCWRVWWWRWSRWAGACSRPRAAGGCRAGGRAAGCADRGGAQPPAGGQCGDHHDRGGDQQDHLVQLPAASGDGGGGRGGRDRGRPRHARRRGGRGARDLRRDPQQPHQQQRRVGEPAGVLGRGDHRAGVQGDRHHPLGPHGRRAAHQAGPHRPVHVDGAGRAAEDHGAADRGGRRLGAAAGVGRVRRPGLRRAGGRALVGDGHADRQRDGDQRGRVPDAL